MRIPEKYLNIVENIGEYFFLSLFLAIAVTFIVESWRKNYGYPVAAVVFGTLLGYGVMNIETWSSFAVLATIVGTITGPATIAVLQKKTVIDVAKDLKDVAESIQNRHNRGGYNYPRRRGGTNRNNDARRLPRQGDPYDD